MTPEALSSYIEELRAWIDDHAAPALGDQYAMADKWQDELEAVEAMLKQKHELPIALLGPSQQGKSSLINALIGETVLAVGGAVGACTCVVTSVHYQPGPEYRAEIECIALRDWELELSEIEKAMAIVAEIEDSDADIEEVGAQKKSAIEKFKAVYRTEPPADLGEYLNDPLLKLPREIARHMESGRPIAIQSGNAKSLRNDVRRYLVGREQHRDGQYWPLISRVRIFGDFSILKNGISLVDLPGLNDPNPAREQVTRKYIEEARYIWLVCNSQTGIDRVLTQVLREDSFLFKMFMEGRLDAFAVIATRVDDMNLGVILEQMGEDPDEFDKDYTKPLSYRRSQIDAAIKEHLEEIAHEIIQRADPSSNHTAFIERVRNVPTHIVSTNAYLNAVGRMPLYESARLTEEQSHIPGLIDYLQTITLEHTYQAQVRAADRRLELLRKQIHAFFLGTLNRIEQASEQAQQEWAIFCTHARGFIQEAHERLAHALTAGQTSLDEHCEAFSQRNNELEGRATSALSSVYSNWDSMNWRTLQAAVSRDGMWFSRSLNREFDLSRDLARAYLELLPFVWEDFFGVKLKTLVATTAQNSQDALKAMGQQMKGAAAMLRQQPSDILESIQGALEHAAEAFELQTQQIQAGIQGEIQRTRQGLSTGAFSTSTARMRPAFELASNVDKGTGIKQRMLNILKQHAFECGPDLFIAIRQDLAEGVAELASSMVPRLAELVEKGKTMAGQFAHNLGTYTAVTPENRLLLQQAVATLPEYEACLY